MAKKGTFTAYQQLRPIQTDLSKPAKEQLAFEQQKTKEEDKAKPAFKSDDADYETTLTGITTEDNVKIQLAEDTIDFHNELEIERLRLHEAGDTTGAQLVRNKQLKMKNVFKNYNNASKLTKDFVVKLKDAASKGQVSALDESKLKDMDSFQKMRNFKAQPTKDGDIIFSTDSVDPKTGEAIINPKTGKPERIETRYTELNDLSYIPHVELTGSTGLVNKITGSLKTHTDQDTNADGTYTRKQVKWDNRLRDNTITYIRGRSPEEFADLYKQFNPESKIRDGDKLSAKQKNEVVDNVLELVKGNYDTSDIQNKRTDGSLGRVDPPNRASAIKYDMMKAVESGDVSQFYGKKFSFGKDGVGTAFQTFITEGKDGKKTMLVYIKDSNSSKIKVEKVKLDVNSMSDFWTRSYGEKSITPLQVKLAPPLEWRTVEKGDMNSKIAGALQPSFNNLLEYKDDDEGTARRLSEALGVPVSVQGLTGDLGIPSGHGTIEIGSYQLGIYQSFDLDKFYNDAGEITGFSPIKQIQDWAGKNLAELQDLWAEELEKRAVDDPSTQVDKTKGFKNGFSTTDQGGADPFLQSTTGQNLTPLNINISKRKQQQQQQQQQKQVSEIEAQQAIFGGKAVKGTQSYKNKPTKNKKK